MISVRLDKAVTGKGHGTDSRFFAYYNHEAKAIRELFGGHPNIIENSQRVKPFDILTKELWNVRFPHLSLQIKTDC